jgi:hypothetical protein
VRYLGFTDGALIGYLGNSPIRGYLGGGALIGYLGNSPIRGYLGGGFSRVPG